MRLPKMRLMELLCRQHEGQWYCAFADELDKGEKIGAMKVSIWALVTCSRLLAVLCSHVALHLGGAAAGRLHVRLAMSRGGTRCRRPSSCFGPTL